MIVMDRRTWKVFISYLLAIADLSKPEILLSLNWLLKKFWWVVFYCKAFSLILTKHTGPRVMMFVNTQWQLLANLLTHRVLGAALWVIFLISLNDFLKMKLCLYSDLLQHLFFAGRDVLPAGPPLTALHWALCLGARGRWSGPEPEVAASAGEPAFDTCKTLKLEKKIIYNNL